MGIFTSIEKRIAWAANVRFDKKTGFFKYPRYGGDIYIRHPRHYLAESKTDWLCENILFKYYLPTGNDFVLDLGAGYGEEAVYLHAKSANVRYLGVEAQPVIYECLANTFHRIGNNFRASPYAISESTSLKFISQFSYASVGEIPEGYIEVPTMPWNDFIEHYGIDEIDLLKMNIEGAEKEVIQQITDFSFIKRFVISCHDFRANNGEGEWYRSRAVVESRLREQGYVIRSFTCGIPWADDWIFAERH